MEKKKIKDYDYGFDPNEKRTRTILFGTVYVEQFGYSKRNYILNVRRILSIVPFLIFGLWLMASELRTSENATCTELPLPEDLIFIYTIRTA